MGNPEKMFACSESDAASSLRQGEILSDLMQMRIDLESIHTQRAENYSLTGFIHPYAIIVSQDCDLEQDFNFRFKARGSERHRLPSILFCEMMTADDLVHGSRQGSIFKSRTAVRNFQNNDDYRFHFIQEIPSQFDALAEGLPELGVEFKRYFSMPAGEVYRRIELSHAQRRCRLKSPYLEHFCDRFHTFNNRIALPEQYEST